MTVSAKVIADSISAQGIRITTMQITLHRYVLAEFNTHRQFSRSFRSSRAVPVAKLLHEVRTNPAVPVAWLKNRPGMQATEPMTENEKILAESLWREGATFAANVAERLAMAGLHKQWSNRGLEPYLYVHGVVTSTEWANFFALRRHPDAQPEMRALADAMWDAREASTPSRSSMLPGQWHLPYIQKADWEAYPLETCIKLSVARCARVSYLTHEGKTPDMAADLALYERLVGSTPLHASPAEHQATPDYWYEPKGLGFQGWHLPQQHANFVGWRQYRQMLPNEHVADR